MLRLSTVVFTYLLAAAGAAKSSCDAIANKTLDRTGVSPDECNADPSNCAYQCSIGYVATVVGSALTLKSTLASGDCKNECFELTGTLQPGESICDIVDGVADKDGTIFTAVYDAATGKASVATVTQGFTCTGSFVTEAAPPEPTPCDIAGKELDRLSVSPAECNGDPDNCAYKCALGYDATVRGSKLTLTSNQNPGGGCECFTLSATLTTSEDGLSCAITDGVADDGDNTKFTATYDSIGQNATVATTTQGVTCTGTFATKTKPEPEPEPEKACSTPSWVTWVLVAAGVIIFILAVVIIVQFLELRKNAAASRTYQAM
jgi:hypothetical protein